MNINKLEHILPEKIFNELPKIIEEFDINTNHRLAHFLGNCHHETGGFKVFTENLNYSSERLLKVFPKYFKTIVQAKLYERNPEKLANKIYANRMGNGDEKSGDGWNFIGRGCIQITGKSNYLSFDNRVDENIIKNPDLVATKYPLFSSANYWSTNNINKICDEGVSEIVIKKVRIKINGGVIGLDDVKTQVKKYYNILT